MGPSGIVTLITDFGLQDPYVGQLKGALLSRWPGVNIVDITHGIDSQDIRSGALALLTSFSHFPERTVHLVVVDPGVGTSRRILTAAGDAHFFVVPDNGLLSPLIEEGRITEIRRVVESTPAASATFHGRDIMAPVAADIASGKSFAATGIPLTAGDCTLLDLFPVAGQEDRITGEIIRIDHFGNIRTSIRQAHILQRKWNALELCAQIRSQWINGLTRTYAEREVGELCLLVDSDGFLELAVNQGSAATLLNAGVGEQVIVYKKPPEAPP